MHEQSKRANATCLGHAMREYIKNQKYTKKKQGFVICKQYGWLRQAIVEEHRIVSMCGRTVSDDIVRQNCLANKRAV